MREKDYQDPVAVFLEDEGKNGRENMREDRELYVITVKEEEIVLVFSNFLKKEEKVDKSANF